MIQKFNSKEAVTETILENIDNFTRFRGDGRYEKLIVLVYIELNKIVDGAVRVFYNEASKMVVL